MAEFPPHSDAHHSWCDAPKCFGPCNCGFVAPAPIFKERLTAAGDRLFPGAPTHLWGWSDWLNALAESGENKSLTRAPALWDTESSKMHWLEKHQIQRRTT